MRSSEKIRRTLNKYQRKPNPQQGILGNEVGTIVVPNRIDYVYVRVAGLGTIAVYNKRVPLILDLPVDVGYDPLEPKNFQVLNIHRYPQGGGRSLVDATTILHGSTHNWAGIDPVFIEKRQLMPLRPTPMGGMNIYVTREVTYYDDNAVLVTGQQLNLAPYVPATGSWLVLLYKDVDEIIRISTGGILKDIFSLSLDDAPQAYPGTVPIALVRLYGGQTGIAEGYQDTDLIDVRQLFSPIDLTGTSSGGGHVIQDEGTSRPQRTNLNFKGGLVWAVDNAGNDSTDIIISGSSSGVSTGTSLADHDHSGDVGDGGQFPLDNLLSETARNGEVASANGSGGIEWAYPVIYVETDVSNPPTNDELTAVLGAADATGPGRSYLIKDTSTSKLYYVGSNGVSYFYLPLIMALTSTPPVNPESIIDVSTQAGWCWFADPRAVYYNGKAYVGWVSSAGHIFAVSFVTATGIVGTPYDLYTVGADDHNNPTILVRDSDKRIIVFFAGHDSTVLGARISTNPEDVTSFGTTIDISAQSGGQVHTYPTPIQLTGETNDPIYLFWRGRVNEYGSPYLRFSKSTNGGTTWNTFTNLAQVTYAKIAQNGTDRIDFAVSNHPGDAVDHSVYHFYYQGGNYYKTDGTQIMSSLPLQLSDLTKVYDGGSTKGWIWDIAIDGTGKPYIVYATFPSTTDHRYNYARWTGAAWETHEIVAGGGYLYADQPYYSGGVVLDRSDPTKVYLSKVVSGQWEVFRYETGDGGTNWADTAITTSSSVKNIRPVSILNHDTNYKFLWLAGTYINYVNYSLTVKAGQ